MSHKKFTHLAGYEIKSVRLIFKNEILIYQPKANVDDKILLDKFTHHLHPEIMNILRKMFVWESRIPHSILAHDLVAIQIQIQCHFEFQK